MVNSEFEKYRTALLAETGNDKTHTAYRLDSHKYILGKA